MDFLLLVCGVEIGDGSDFWLATSEPVPPPSDSCSNDSDTDTDLKLDRKVNKVVTVVKFHDHESESTLKFTD